MKKDGLFQLTWLSLENLIILYYMASIQICPNVLSQAGEMRSSQE